MSLQARIDALKERHANLRWRYVTGEEFTNDYVYAVKSRETDVFHERYRQLDALVIDLQDVGARIYTFVYTMANCLRAAARHRIPVVVCDRPNPIGGGGVGGNMLKPEWASFVGPYPLPMRHGLSAGEFLSFAAGYHGLDVPLTVIQAPGWSRTIWPADTQ